jgi:hypothetical protein
MRDCITRVTELLAGGAEGAVQRAMRNSFLISAGGLLYMLGWVGLRSGLLCCRRMVFGVLRSSGSS